MTQKFAFSLYVYLQILIDLFPKVWRQGQSTPPPQKKLKLTWNGQTRIAKNNLQFALLFRS